MKAPGMLTALCSLITLTSVAIPALALDNDQFATKIEEAKPVLWREYEPLSRDFVGCIAGIEPARLTHSVCAQLNQRRSRILFDALKQAVRLNVSSPQKCPRGASRSADTARQIASTGTLRGARLCTPPRAVRG